MSQSLAPPLLDLWVYLSGGPLLWLTVTVVAYVIADRISAWSGRHPLANPVVIAVALIGALLVATGTSYPLLLRRRAVRAFPAWARHGRAGRPARETR